MNNFSPRCTPPVLTMLAKWLPTANCIASRPLATISAIHGMFCTPGRPAPVRSVVGNMVSKKPGVTEEPQFVPGRMG